MELHSTLLVVVLSVAGLAGARWLLTGAQVQVAAESAQVPLLLVGACAVGAAVLVIASATSQSARRHAPGMLVVGAVTVAGLLVAEPWLRLGLLEAGALLTVLLVFQTARGGAVKFSYFAVVLISAGCSVSGELLGNERGQAWKGALLLTGICVKLAAVPFFFWLLRMADEIPAVVLGTIIAVVDMAAFGEFLLGAQANAGMFGSSPILLYAAAATSLIAALLMLTQRSLKRLLVLSTIEDIGFLLLGVATASRLGAEGALAGAATHALAKALLFACLSAPESAGDLNPDARGLAARYPVSAFGFLFGMLAMLGVPPMLGFVGRWRLYESALRIHPALAAVFIASSALALIAYVLALTRNWWGPPASSGSSAREPRVLQSAIVVVVAILLAAGMWPQLAETLLGGRL